MVITVWKLDLAICFRRAPKSQGVLISSGLVKLLQKSAFKKLGHLIKTELSPRRHLMRI